MEGWYHFAFRQHEKSLFHKLAVEKLLTLPATTRNVGEMLSTALVQERENKSPESTVNFNLLLLTLY